LSQEQIALRQMLERREREYLLANTKVKVRSSMENFEAGDFVIAKLEEGSTAELPRWVADELVGLKLAEEVEEPFDVEVLKALSREKMMGPLQLSSLPSDFYLRMRRRIGGLSGAVAEGRTKKEESDRVRAGCQDIVGIRLSKLLSLSSSATPVSTLEGKVTPEEAAFFSSSQGLSKEWRKAFLEAGK